MSLRHASRFNFGCCTTHSKNKHHYTQRYTVKTVNANGGLSRCTWLVQGNGLNCSRKKNQQKRFHVTKNEIVWKKYNGEKKYMKLNDNKHAMWQCVAHWIYIEIHFKMIWTKWARWSRKYALCYNDIYAK